MKVTCLSGYNFDHPEYGPLSGFQESEEAAEVKLRSIKTEDADRRLVMRFNGKLESQKAEGTLCTEETSGKSKMAAKRKGGLKLNAICAKLSRQVVFDSSSQNAEGDSDLVENGKQGGLHYDEDDRSENDFPEGLTLGQSLEKDQKRREAIEKWVNGEYADDPQSLDGFKYRMFKPSNGDNGPPEGGFMVPPKGYSVNEDNTEEAESLPGSHKGGCHEDRNSEGSSHKDHSYQLTTASPPQQAPLASSGEPSATNTMNEFLHMFGCDDQQVGDELAATSDPSSVSSEEATCQAYFSKYKEYIRKLKAGETLPWPLHAKPEEPNSKMAKKKSVNLIQTPLSGTEGQILTPEMDHKQNFLSTTPTNPLHMPNLVSRASKYDRFIQKLKMAESLRQQNENFQQPSKYDLENIKFLLFCKPGEGNPDMGGAIAFKTGKVGRPSKYDIRNTQKLIPGKVDPSIMPDVLPTTAEISAMPVINTATPAGVTGPPGLPADQVGHLGFNTDFMRSSFSRSDSLTTRTISTIKNTLPPEKPESENINVYQKYIARFSGSQHCGLMQCAYEYKEHYHCLDPECNYQRFTGKQDMIRHYNMHKKRDNSLQHGFMRFGPLDNCSVYYHDCHFNGKSTHYHCMQLGCNKVYTSTSDVMNHENFHKKNAQLINDGFQRFRATEDCGAVNCQFYGQKTTHFHCRRPSCTFTFKNKCDIEKHKGYHIKDDVYTKDGFKKFYKYEECKYEGCVYSKATNHFHCIRDGCSFTFTSTSQMTSHKRKHERRHIRSLGVLGPGSSLLLPKEEQEESSNDDLMDFSTTGSKNSSLSASPTRQQSPTVPHLLPTPTTTASSSQSAKPSASKGTGQSAQWVEVKQELVDGTSGASQDSSQERRPENPAELWRTHLRRYDTEDFCEARCDFLHKIHFHCLVEDCGALFSTVNGAIKHANFHLRASLKVKSQPNESRESSDSTPHQMAASVSMASSLQAWKQLAGSVPQLPASMPGMPVTSPPATISLENARPQVKPGFLQFQDNDPCLATDCKYTNQFHFHCLFENCRYVCKTSGKAESHCLDHINPDTNPLNVRDQFCYYSPQRLCPNQHCEFRTRGHYHCLRADCCFITNITTKLPWHIKKHEKAERRATNGFKYFTKREECGRLGCKYKQVSSHFHCIREGCQFSFLLKHQMTSHARKHMRRMLGKNFHRAHSQVVSHACRSEEMQHMVSLPSSGVLDNHLSVTSNCSSMMEEHDDCVDSTGGGSPLGPSSESSSQNRSCTSTPVGNDSSPAGKTISIPTATVAKKRLWNIKDMSPFGKNHRKASPHKMLDKGVMPKEFCRYDLHEDCMDPACQFSLKVTHYHCTRDSCGYKFSGRTHMYKHAQHHHRVDNLVLDDFKRFKSSLLCNFPDCQLSGTSTHFHCLRCGFRCTDSTKVMVHRKHHGKQDTVSAAGFCQFSSSVDCEVTDCKYKLKCSHFHCTYPECKHAVAGLSQMDSHKRKHEKQERCELPSLFFKQDGSHHPADQALPLHLPPTSPEQEHPVNLNGSLNLILSNSIDLNKKMHWEPLSPDRGSSPATSVGLTNPQDNTTGRSGDPEDDLSAEEEPVAEKDDDDDEEEEEEPDEDMNIDSYEDSIAVSFGEF